MVEKQSFLLDCASRKRLVGTLDHEAPGQPGENFFCFPERAYVFVCSNCLNEASRGFSHQDLVVQNCGLIPNYTTMYLSWPSLSSQWGTKTTGSCSSKQGLET